MQELMISTGRRQTWMIWAMMMLDQPSQERIGEFFVRNFSIKKNSINKQMHLTIYHARRPLLGIQNQEKDISVRIQTRDLRFMVMVPGGENKRPDVDPETSPIGLRVNRRSEAMNQILEFRRHLSEYETSKVLGQRRPSTARRNAFGARHFQPHVTVLWRGKELGGDLSPVGLKFRSTIEAIHFDRLVVDCKEPQQEAS
jgi:hypothetical protein